MSVRLSHRRDGYTLMEVLLVVTVIVILGSVLVPTLSSFMRDTNVKGAADICVARLADARGYALEEGRPYRFSVSNDGKHIRVSPDEVDGTGQPLDATDIPAHIVDAELPTGVTLTPDQEQRDMGDGYIRIVTFLPDGTCRERAPDFQLIEAGNIPLIVQVRGMTGAVTVNANPAGTARSK